jgi:putative ABC transport system permease protein
MRALHGFGADLTLAARRLFATPAFTIFAIASLAVGVGVTTIVYSIVDSLFWRKLGISDPASAVVLVTAGNGRYQRTSVSIQDYEDLRSSIPGLRGVTGIWTLGVSAALPSRPERLSAEAVDGVYFHTLSAGAALGRTIEVDDVRAARHVVVLSHHLWRKKFRSDPSVLGAILRLEGIPFEIIGVAAPPFQGTRPGFDGTSLWIPLSSADATLPDHVAVALAKAPNARRWNVYGRLKPGASIGSVAQQVAGLATTLDRDRPHRFNIPARLPQPRRWSVLTFQHISDEEAEATRIAYVIVALAGLVLVVACTNLSNLILARGTARHHEVAVRRALGASRARLVREQLSESLIIAALGAVASYIALQLLKGWMTADFVLLRQVTLSIAPEIHTGTLAVAAGMMLIALIVFGLEPALQLTRMGELRGDLASAGGSVGLPRVRRHRFLLRWQVAISAGFFILATMFVRYTVQQIRHDPGIRLEGLGMAELNFSVRGWDETRIRSEIARLMEAASLSGVAEGEVAVSSGLPFGTSNPSAELSVPGSSAATAGQPQRATVVAATSNIFRMLGVPILRGRAFDGRDDSRVTPVVVLNERAALAVFGTTDAVGRQLQIGVSAAGVEANSTLATMIGVARDTDTRYLSEKRSPVIYMPLAQHTHRQLTITGRAATAAAAAGALDGLIRRTNPDIPVDYVGEASAVLTGPYVLLRAAGIVTVSLGVVTLLLAMVGLFGIQSHIVTHRTREIGVRMAFGATAGRIKTMVLKDGYKPVLQGLAMGVFIGLSGRAIVRSYLDADVSVLDPWMLLVVPIPLLLAALCACWLPARRASRVEPMEALRHL